MVPLTPINTPGLLLVASARIDGLPYSDDELRAFESLAQVASQTLQNLSVIENAATLPVLRPLVGMDKQEIIDQARRIGTFETSALPDQDCCQLFVPRHPDTKASLIEVEKAESRLDLPALIQLGVENGETLDFKFP